MPKIIKKLSEAEIRNAKPKEKDYKLCDEGGLRLLVRSTGTKVWQYPYKFHGKSNVYTIGQYCPKGRAGFVGTADARKMRDEIREMIDQGVNPNQHKKMHRYDSEEMSKTTFEALGKEWHSKGTWVDKHSKNILRSLEDDVFPLIGYKQVHQVTTQDVIQVLSKVEERGAPDVAKRICQRCEAIFDYAMMKGLCENNPASGRSRFVKPPERKNRPHLQEKQIGEFVHKLEAYDGKDYIRLSIKLLMLTFVRPGELRNARWEEFDMKEAVWTVPATRMKMRRDHIVPLSTQAKEILEEIHALTGNTDFLVPGVISPHKPISDVTMLKVFKLMGYEGDKKITPHGFRHTASTILNENGFNSDAIERQLAHIDKNRIRGTYNKAEHLAERVEMMQWYSNHIDRLAEAYVKNGK